MKEGSYLPYRSPYKMSRQRCHSEESINSSSSYSSSNSDSTDNIYTNHNPSYIPADLSLNHNYCYNSNIQFSPSHYSATPTSEYGPSHLACSSTLLADFNSAGSSAASNHEADLSTARADSPNSRANQNAQRTLLRPWLMEQVKSRCIPGLEWLDESCTLLRIPWKHGSRNGWSSDDCKLFESWAKQSGKVNGMERNARRWKANFRCALRSLTDVKEVRNMSRKTGRDAFRVYQFLPPKQRKRSGHTGQTTTIPVSQISNTYNLTTGASISQPQKQKSCNSNNEPNINKMHRNAPALHNNNNNNSKTRMQSSHNNNTTSHNNLPSRHGQVNSQDNCRQDTRSRQQEENSSRISIQQKAQNSYTTEFEFSWKNQESIKKEIKHEILNYNTFQVSGNVAAVKEPKLEPTGYPEAAKQMKLEPKFEPNWSDKITFDCHPVYNNFESYLGIKYEQYPIMQGTGGNLWGVVGGVEEYVTGGAGNEKMDLWAELSPIECSIIEDILQENDLLYSCFNFEEGALMVS